MPGSELTMNEAELPLTYLKKENDKGHQKKGFAYLTH